MLYSHSITLVLIGSSYSLHHQWNQQDWIFSIIRTIEAIMNPIPMAPKAPAKLLRLRGEMLDDCCCIICFLVGWHWWISGLFSLYHLDVSPASFILIILINSLLVVLIPPFKPSYIDLYPLLIESVWGKFFCITQARRKVIKLSSFSLKLHFPVALKSACIDGTRNAFLAYYSILKNHKFHSP